MADQILLGTITIDMSVETHFGFFTGLVIKNEEGLGVRFTADASDNRVRFGVNSPGDPGKLILQGVLASTIPGADSFCSSLSSLVSAATCGTIYSSVTVNISFDFNDSDDISLTLTDVKVSGVSAQVDGMLMSGEVVFTYVNASSSS